MIIFRSMRDRHIYINYSKDTCKWITKLQYLSKTTNMSICGVSERVHKAFYCIFIVSFIGLSQVSIL